MSASDDLRLLKIRFKFRTAVSSILGSQQVLGHSSRATKSSYARSPRSPQEHGPTTPSSARAATGFAGCQVPSMHAATGFAGCQVPSMHAATGFAGFLALSAHGRERHAHVTGTHADMRACSTTALGEQTEQERCSV